MYYERNPWNGITTTLHFSNMAAVALYRCELAGQISDGLYENRKPEWHWKWIWNAKPVISEKQGYEMSEPYAMNHVVRYSLRSLISHIGKNDDWSWTSRILTYAKLGSVIPEDKLKVFWEESRGIESLAEELERRPDCNTVEEFRNGVASYNRNYIDECSLFTDSLIQNFHNSQYGMKELKRDAKSLSVTVNERI